MMAIGQGALERFGDQVKVLGAIVAEGLEVVTLDDVQRDRQRRSLAPGSAAIELVPTVGCLDGRLKFDREASEVVESEQAAVLLAKACYLFGHLASIEEVANGLQASAPSTDPSRGR